MGRSSAKASNLVVSAIQKLRQVQGSTPREIMKYITSEYCIPESVVKRQMNAALKRGLSYGILKLSRGHYSLATDNEFPPLQERRGRHHCKKKKRRYRKCKKTRRCARGCVRPKRRRKKRCKGRHRSRDIDTAALSASFDEQNPQRHQYDEETIHRSRSCSSNSCSGRSTSSVRHRELRNERRNEMVED